MHSILNLRTDCAVEFANQDAAVTAESPARAHAARQAPVTPEFGSPGAVHVMLMIRKAAEAAGAAAGAGGDGKVGAGAGAGQNLLADSDSDSDSGGEDEQAAMAAVLHTNGAGTRKSARNREKALVRFCQDSTSTFQALMCCGLTGWCASRQSRSCVRDCRQPNAARAFAR